MTPNVQALLMLAAAIFIALIVVLVWSLISTMGRSRRDEEEMRQHGVLTGEVSRRFVETLDENKGKKIPEEEYERAREVFTKIMEKGGKDV